VNEQRSLQQRDLPRTPAVFLAGPESRLVWRVSPEEDFDCQH